MNSLEQSRKNNQDFHSRIKKSLALASTKTGVDPESFEISRGEYGYWQLFLISLNSLSQLKNKGAFQGPNGDLLPLLTEFISRLQKTLPGYDNIKAAHQAEINQKLNNYNS